MTRLRRIALGAAVALALYPACSTIGDEGGEPSALPHGGTGAFRLLDSEETEIIGAIPGRAMVLRDAIGGYCVLDDSLFYATAEVLEDRPMVPEDHPAGDIFWPGFEPRRIHRGTAREEGVGGFAQGPEVLAASEGWEGGEVFDPWAVRDGDTVRLYYAAQGGIGVAEASSVEGPFEKRDGPIVTDALDGAPHRPSVIRGPDGAWWMYYDAGGELRAARSDDGLDFEPMGAIELTGDDEGAGTEVAVVSPGALRVETPADRVLVRLYFESVRDGELEEGLSHRIYVAGSEDGLVFERFARPVLRDQTDVRLPAPVAIDDRRTLLYVSLPFAGGPLITRAVSVSVAPGGFRFVVEEE